jgi:hypothetical protein
MSLIRRLRNTEKYAFDSPSTYRQGDQMSLCKKIAKMNPFFVETNAKLLPSKKLSVLLQSSKKLPKVNNRPRGESSPNLVTLPVRMKIEKHIDFSVIS